MNRPDLEAKRLLLEEQAGAARRSLAGELETLAARLEPGSIAATLAARAADAVRGEIDRALSDAGRWLRANALLLGGAAAVLGAIAALGYGTTRRATGHARKAQSMEDEMDDKERALSWDRVREGAGGLGQKASETYFHARSKAAELGAVARERAHDAAEDAGEAAERAARWAKRQPQENPMTSVIIGFAFGAILAALLPGGRKA